MFEKIKKINEYTLGEMYISIQYQKYPIGKNDYDNPYSTSFRDLYSGEDNYLCQLTGYYNYKQNIDVYPYIISPALFKEDEDSNYWKSVCLYPEVEKVFTLFLNRNWNNYIAKYIFFAYPNEELSFPSNSEWRIFTQQLWNQVINNILSIFEMTQEKYLKLFSIYNTERNNLLNKLERSRNLTTNDGRATSNSSTSTTKVNLTPQSEYSPETYNNFTNRVDETKDNGSTSDTFNGYQAETFTEDRDYLMTKIDEIDKKYQNLLKRWASELDKLCWEE